MKIIRIIACIISTLSATYAYSATETTFTASRPLGTAIWDLEVRNKWAKDIFITIENNGHIILKRFKVHKPQPHPDLTKEESYGVVRATGLDLKKATKITIYPYKDQEDVYATHYVTKGNGKTIYVTWENDELRPQKGTGFFNKETQSGLPLKNNVSSSDLKRFQVGRDNIN